MKLSGKKLLMLISDGVLQTEVDSLKKGFEAENALVLITSPQEFLSVESVCNDRRGKDILIDIPFEAIEEKLFDGLIIPDGALGIDNLRGNKKVLQTIVEFHNQGRAIFASGEAQDLLLESGVLMGNILVREEDTLDVFMNKAVRVLLDAPPNRMENSSKIERSYRLYRPTMS